MTNFKSYKGEIGRLEFLKTLFACCIVNWIISTIITIAASAINPIFIILFALCLYVNLLTSINKYVIMWLAELTFLGWLKTCVTLSGR